MSEQIEIELPTFMSFSKKVGTEKIMIGLGKNGRHITLMAKGNKNTYDIHLTFEKPWKKHVRLLELPKPLVHELADKFIENMIHLYKTYWFNDTMNAGKMKKYKMILSSIDGNKEVEDEFIAKAVEGKKYSFKRKLPLAILEKMLFEPDEALACDSNIFMTYRIKNKSLIHQGIVIKNTHLIGRGQFWFISNKNLKKFNMDAILSIRQILGEAEFPYKEDNLRAFDILIEKRFRQHNTISKFKGQRA